MPPISNPDSNWWQIATTISTASAAIVAAIAVVFNAIAVKAQTASIDFTTANDLRLEYDKFVDQLDQAQEDEKRRTKIIRSFLNHLEILAAFQIARKFEPLTNDLVVQYLIEIISVFRASPHLEEFLTSDIDNPRSLEKILEFEIMWNATITQARKRTLDVL